MNRKVSSSIISLAELKKKRKNLKNVALVGGVFDILHTGHIQQLRKAKALCDVLIVHITGDRRVQEKKGTERPIFSERERAEIISSIRFVDYVFIFNGRHYDQNVIDALRPNLLIFHKEAFNRQVQEAVKSLKNFRGKVVVFRGNKKWSSSEIIKRLAKAEKQEK